MIEALTLSRHAVTGDLPLGVVRHVVLGEIKSLEELHAARLDAADGVTAPAFMFLDDTDALPSSFDYAAAASALTATGLVSFDTNIRYASGSGQIRGFEWSPEVHRLYPTRLHNAIISTDAYRYVRHTMRRGLYWTEFMLYYAVACARGAHYIPECGYIYNSRDGGMSQNPLINIAIKNSVLWSRNLGLNYGTI